MRAEGGPGARSSPDTGRAVCLPTQLRDGLRQLTPAASPDLQAAWKARANASLAALAAPPLAGPEGVTEQYLILAKCRDEKRQVELLERFGGEGLECRALLA